MIPTREARGERGSWFASVDGERLPCVHSHWIRKGRHVDPGYNPELHPKFIDLYEAIDRLKKVIVTKDHVTGDDERHLSFARTGYVAVFRITELEASDGELKFSLAERLCNLK